MSDLKLGLADIPNAGTRIAMVGWDGADTPSRCKAISGARAYWVESVKAASGKRFACWHYPVDAATLAVLRQEFPTARIGYGLADWSAQEEARQAVVNEYRTARNAEPVDLPIVRKLAPTIWGAMAGRGYQTTVPAFAQSVGNYFNGSQPGTGKTIETLASLVECGVGQHILVVAPRKSLRATWSREIERWLAPDLDTMTLVLDSQHGTMTERNHSLGYLSTLPEWTEKRFTFVLVNPEVLRWRFTCDNGCGGKTKSCPARSTHTQVPDYPELFEITWDCIILDETHKIMMNANERSGGVSGWGYGAQKLKVSKTGNLTKIGMSGTPFKGKPRRFWPVLHWLDSKKYSGQHKWNAQYFEMEADSYAYDGQKVTDILRSDREEIFNKDLSQVMIRHTKKELRAINPDWAPPEKIHVDVRIPMDSKQAKAYDSMVKDASAKLDNGLLTAEGCLAELTRMKQLASSYASVSGSKVTPQLPSNKWDWIKDALEERGLIAGVGRGDPINDGDLKIVIASQYVSLLKLFAAEMDRMGFNYFHIWGEGKDNTEEVQADWQSDSTETRILLLSTMAGGVSLTLDAADDLVLVDETFVPDDQEQVEDRVHRTSRTDHQVTIYHLRSEGTIDETIAENNVEMDFTQKNILDGSRGVEVLRTILEGSK